MRKIFQTKTFTFYIFSNLLDKQKHFRIFISLNLFAFEGNDRFSCEAPLNVKGYGMLTLKLDEIPDEGLDLKWREERASLLGYLRNFSKIDFDFEAPLQSEARISKAGQSVLIKGKVETQLRLHCVRCLKEFTYPLSSTFELTLHPVKETAFEEETQLGGDEMESSFFEGEEIRLSEIACEQIFLEIPYQPLCHEGCKGLCPICGNDLNLSSCGCAKEEFASGFSALKKLKLESS